MKFLICSSGIGELDENQNATSISLSTIRDAMEINFFGVGQTTIAFLPLVWKATNAVILNVTIDMAIKTGCHIARCAIEYQERARYYFIYQCIGAGIESRRHQREHSVTPGLFTATKLNHLGCKTMKGAEALLPWTYCWIR